MKDYVTSEERTGLICGNKMIDDVLVIVGWFVFISIVICELLKR